jgi:hypothetical protein
MTSGRGDFELELDHYDEVPSHIADKIVKESQAASVWRLPGARLNCPGEAAPQTCCGVLVRKLLRVLKPVLETNRFASARPR